MSNLNMGDAALIVDIVRTHYSGIGGDSASLVGAEVGSHRGATSAALLRAFPRLMLFMVDSWDAHPENSDYRKSGDSLAKLSYDEQTAHMHAAISATSFAHPRRTVLRIPSVIGAKRVPVKRLDFVFEDAAHDYESVKASTAAWWPLVREPMVRPAANEGEEGQAVSGGIMAFHDYTHPRNDRNLFGVKRAVDEFVAAEGLELSVTGSIAWVVKGRLAAKAIGFDEAESISPEEMKALIDGFEARNIGPPAEEAKILGDQ